VKLIGEPGRLVEERGEEKMLGHKGRVGPDGRLG
jgi:hypothetical protein